MSNTVFPLLHIYTRPNVAEKSSYTATDPVDVDDAESTSGPGGSVTNLASQKRKSSPSAAHQRHLEAKRISALRKQYQQEGEDEEDEKENIDWTENEGRGESGGLTPVEEATVHGNLLCIHTTYMVYVVTLGFTGAIYI